MKHTINWDRVAAGAWAIIGVAVLAVLLVANSARAIGTNPVENYTPAIKYNEGYYSTLPIQTTSSLTAGGATFSSIISSGAVTIAGALALAATTTNSSDYWSQGGIDYASVQQSFTSATTTPCSIPNPFGSATSTVLNYMAQITVGTSTAATFDVATSSTPYATSTPAFIFGASIASGAQKTSVWTPGIPGLATTTPTGVLGYEDFATTGESPYILGPNEYLNFKTAGAGLSGYTYTGTCSATVMKP